MNFARCFTRPPSIPRRYPELVEFGAIGNHIFFISKDNRVSFIEVVLCSHFIGQKRCGLVEPAQDVRDRLGCLNHVHLCGDSVVSDLENDISFSE